METGLLGREGGAFLLFLCCWTSRGGWRDSFVLGTQGSPSWSPRLGRRPLVPENKMVTCCFLSDPRTHGMGRGTYYSRSLSIRLFIPAPLIRPPGPLAPSLSISPLISPHPPIDPTPLLPVHLPSLHICPSDHLVVRPSCCTAHIQCACSGPTLHLREKWAWSLDLRKPLSEASFLESPACMSLLIPLGRERRPAA